MSKAVKSPDTGLMFLKWAFYTVGVGALPGIIRAITHFVTSGRTPMFDSYDFITLGLVIHISLINEMENSKKMGMRSTTIYNGISSIMIPVYGFLISCGSGLIAGVSGERLLSLSQFLSVVSLLIGLNFFRAQSSADNRNG